MTWDARAGYCLLSMEQWQYKAAFVVQFRPGTDIEAGRYEGRVEHMASSEAMRFHSLEELLDFIARSLARLDDAESP